MSTIFSQEERTEDRWSLSFLSSRLLPVSRDNSFQCFLEKPREELLFVRYLEGYVGEAVKRALPIRALYLASR